MGNPAGSPHMANLSSTPASFAGGQASWYDDILTRLGKQPAWPEDKEQAIMEPYCYLDAHPGKEVRSQLIQAFNEWLCVPHAKLEVIRKVVRMLHTSSLLMDDVEDNSDLRRGIPVAHRIYGIPQTINTANYVYFLVFEEIFKMSATPIHSATSAGASVPSSLASSSGRVERFVVEEMINLHRGQGMDLFWRDCLICPTEEEYVEMVSNKTGGLFRIALKLMMAHSPLFASEAQSRRIPDFLPLADIIGLLFQIRDDYMNLQSTEYADNKGFAEDLTEGKFSFPIIHAIRSSGGGASSSGNNLQASEADAAAWSGTPPVGPSPMNAAVPLPNLDRDSHSRSSSAHEPPSPIPPNRQILNVLKQRPTDLATKQYTVTYMRQVTKSFAYTRDVLRRLDKQAIAEVERIRNELTNLAQADAASCARADDGAKMLIKILQALRSGWYDTADE